MRIYIGNLNHETTESQIRKSFEKFGELTSLKMIKDNESGKPRGFAFVEMSEKDKAIAAIIGLNGNKINGRTLNVKEAKQKTESGNREGGNHYYKMY